ncbi:hypothetical protein D3C85_1377800 [compost metagenome]
MTANCQISNEVMLTSNHCAALARELNVVLDAAPAPPACSEPDDPCYWSDAQILDFLGVALRNVDVRGTVHLKEIRQGFEYMRAIHRKVQAAKAEVKS